MRTLRPRLSGFSSNGQRPYQNNFMLDGVDNLQTAFAAIYGQGMWVIGGSLVAFLLYSGRFFRPISDMSEKFNVLQAAMASSERIFKILDEKETIVSPPAPSGAETTSGQ